MTASNPTTTEPRPRRDRALADLGTVLLLFVIGAAIPVAIAAHYGALEIPRSDDWSYLLTLFNWVDGGRLDFNGWVSMTLVGQLALAAPLVLVAGRSIAAVHVLSAFVSFLGLLAVVWMGRLIVRPALALLVALTVAASPLWGPLAATYMTDNWAFTFQIAALALAFEAFRRKPLSVPWLSASMAVGILAVSIRQYAVIPVAAVAVVALVLVARERDRTRFVRVLGIMAIAGVAAIAVVAIWSNVPNTKVLTPSLPTLRLLRRTVKLDTGYLRLFGALLAPVVIAAGPVRLVRRAWRASRTLSVLVVAAPGGWMLLQYSRLPNVPFVGNYLAREGVLAQDVLAGVRPAAVPSVVFDALAWVGMLSILVILLTMVPFVTEIPGKLRQWRHVPDSPEVAVLGLSLFGFGVAYTLATLTDLPVFDRYALPLFPMLALLVLRSAGRPPEDATPAADPPDDAALAEPGAPRPDGGARQRMVLAFVAAGLLALVGFAFTAESASFDATRWGVGEAVVAKGYSPLQIDEGFEWVGWHREHGPPWRVTSAFSERRKIRKIFTRPFCVKVEVGRNVAKRFVIAEAESTAPTRGPAKIVARRLNKPCVPGKPVCVKAARLVG